jgi:hypothetical protein
VIFERGLVQAQTSAAASASLAEFVGEAAAEAGVRLGAIQVAADSTTGKRYRRVRVSTEGTGGVREVTTFVSRLEATDARVAIREFGLTQADPSAGPERPEALRITLVIDALAIGPNDSSKATRVVRDAHERPDDSVASTPSRQRR